MMLSPKRHTLKHFILFLGILFSVFAISAFSPFKKTSSPPSTESFMFPENFLWGAATSSHQVEGGNTNNDWYEWENLGFTKDKSSFASDHYHRYVQDFDLAKAGHHNAYRMSLEWSRIEPEHGKFSEAAIEHYRSMLLAARERGLKTFVTLHHFTNPLWMAKLGGWLNPDAPLWFEHFTVQVVEKLGDLIDFWITINEPNIYILTGYSVGVTPPGVKDTQKAVEALVQLMKAHAKAYHAIHKIYSNALVGFAHHMRSFTPFRLWHAGDKMISHFIDSFWNHQILKAMTLGKISFYLPFILNYKEEYPELKNTLDFIGINYYSRDIIQIDWDAPYKFAIVPNSESEKSDLAWEIYPKGLYDVIQAAAHYKLPIYITENGIADAADIKRTRYICSHLKEMTRAIQEGADVRGYLHWSLLDNFEWVEGFSPRFGLIEIDYQTQTRTVRNSAKLFSQIITSHSLDACNKH